VPAMPARIARARQQDQGPGRIFVGMAPIKAPPRARVLSSAAMPWPSEGELDHLVARFRAATLPKPEWTHAAHLATGSWHVHHLALRPSRAAYGHPAVERLPWHAQHRHQRLPRDHHARLRRPASKPSWPRRPRPPSP
jgi:hypothetical protein